MTLIALVDLPAPGAHRLTAAELNLIFAQFIQVPQFGAVLLSWFQTLPTSPPTTNGLPWNNGGIVTISSGN